MYIIVGFFLAFFLIILYNYKGFAQNLQSKTTERKPTVEDDKEEKAAKPLRIISPLPNLIYKPGQEIDVEIEADEKIQVVSVALTTGEHLIIQQRPFAARMVIPENFSGSQISVIAAGATKDAAIIGMDMLDLNVQVEKTIPFERFMPPGQDSNNDEGSIDLETK